MKEINYLTHSLALTVLSFGLIGCAPDKLKGNSKAAWSLPEPQVIREQNAPLSFKQAELEYKGYLTSDILSFESPKSAPANVVLSVTSECVIGDRRLMPHSFSGPLKNRYYFYEFLSQEALYADPKAQNALINCKFDFIAKNSDGDSHSFEVRYSPITVDQIKNRIKIGIVNVDKKSPHAQQDYLALSASELEKYTLRANSTPTEKYEIYCNDLIGATHSRDKLFHWDELVFSNRETHESVSQILNDQLCRVFAIEANGQLTSYSNLFVLQSEKDRPLIKNLTTKRSTIGIFQWGSPLSTGSYWIQNSSSEKMNLLIHKNISTQITIAAFSHKFQKNIGIRYLLPTQVRVVHAPITVTDTEIRFTLEPGQSTKVDLSIVVKQISCGEYEKFLGIYYGPNRETGYTFTRVNKVPGATNKEYEMQLLEFESPYEAYAIPFTDFNSRGNQPVPAVVPILEEYKEGLCAQQQ